MKRSTLCARCAPVGCMVMGEIGMSAFTIPNLLTYFRLCVGAGLLGVSVFYPSSVQALYFWALAFTALAFASDYVDGWIARRWPSQQSWLGVIIDPPADKVVVGGAMFYLIAIGAAHGGYEYLCFALIMIREFSMWVVRMMGRVGYSVSSWGKWKTAAQMSALGLYFLVPVAPSSYTPAAVMLGVALVLTWWSFIVYLYPRPSVQVNP